VSSGSIYQALAAAYALLPLLDEAQASRLRNGLEQALSDDIRSPGGDTSRALLIDAIRAARLR